MEYHSILDKLKHTHIQVKLVLDDENYFDNTFWFEEPEFDELYQIVTRAILNKRERKKREDKVVSVE